MPQHPTSPPCIANFDSDRVIDPKVHFSRLLELLDRDKLTNMSEESKNQLVTSLISLIQLSDDCFFAPHLLRVSFEVDGSGVTYKVPVDINYTDFVKQLFSYMQLTDLRLKPDHYLARCGKAIDEVFIELATKACKNEFIGSVKSQLTGNLTPSNYVIGRRDQLWPALRIRQHALQEFIGQQTDVQQNHYKRLVSFLNASYTCSTELDQSLKALLDEGLGFNLIQILVPNFDVPVNLNNATNNNIRKIFYPHVLTDLYFMYFQFLLLCAKNSPRKAISLDDRLDFLRTTFISLCNEHTLTDGRTIGKSQVVSKGHCQANRVSQFIASTVDSARLKRLISGQIDTELGPYPLYCLPWNIQMKAMNKVFVLLRMLETYAQCQQKKRIFSNQRRNVDLARSMRRVPEEETLIFPGGPSMFNAPQRQQGLDSRNACIPQNFISSLLGCCLPIR